LKVVILCGGKGIRIREVSDELPKPMVRIGRYPILKHIMDIYSNHGFNEFILCLGYRGWQIKEYFLNYRAATQDLELSLKDGTVITHDADGHVPPWNLILAETGLDSQTGSRISQIRDYTDGETFLLTYGDGVGNVDITTLMDFHRSHGKLATITSVRPPSRFGEMHVQGALVTRFDEKPQAHGGLINGGFFVCEQGVFDYLSDDADLSFEQEPLRLLAEDGQLMTYRHDGFWMPMDTSREYLLLNELWKTGDAPWLPTRPTT
jgi:glucose-1-phosphate cytidylyltransferase